MRRRGAFTLIEMLAVILLTSIVMGVALNHYFNLSQVSQRATETTAEVRRATAILDRVSRDLESVMLVAKAPETDPLEHPWVFIGESRRVEEGADHLLFVTRGRRPRAGAGHQSDLELVAYSLRRAETDDSYELMRWSSPQLPSGLDRTIPSEESDGAALMAEGLAHFGVTFINEFDERSSTWDSSMLGESGELPVAVDVSVALVDYKNPDTEPRPYRRRVVLPVRPLDMQALLDPTSLINGGGAGEEEDEQNDFVGEDPNDPRVTPACAESPCAGFLACAIINCQANIGRYGESQDLMLEETLREQPTYCQWRFSQQRSIVGLFVANPECQ